ncbi:hypothetical protein ACMWRE_000906 [Pseudomonas aeruginosa]|uniref:hypothetical protein n=1 Tax=Pseudomonas aeruginosa TaxID=287 RepID=UPI000E31DC6B|nr:hypothetical protein [Pseudomonas aeruginosa]NPY00636.1 hypothetical protein [Pseudomonas aeruginosa]HEJ1534563.1 hypothetical protein [Pseudomonas aeruginosa]HEK1373015.1 hypothetical protein [Pseudomonas aeruginosa]
MSGMSFQNLPVTIIGLLAGWMFTIYLQRRANHRAEALKRKDKLIDKLEDLSDWVEGEISKVDFNPSNTERSYTGLLTQVEIRIRQLNAHVRKDVIDPSALLELRDVDFFADKETLPGLPYDIRDEASDVIERIEEACDKFFFKSSLLCKAESVFDELKGVIAGLGVVILVLLLGKLITLFY